ncbi:MAG: HAD family hydrolase [Terriglobales bacterium]
MIRTVIFDLGRTLVPFSFDRLRPSLDGCREAALAWMAPLETGVGDWDAFVATLGSRVGVTAGEFEAWWCGIFDLQPLISPQWLTELRRTYRLGLLSNTNACHFGFLRREMPWLEGFDFHVLSYEVGAVKPQPEIYAAAERQAACQPGEILYFDDVPEFVAAAARRGWRAEQFADEAAARAAVHRWTQP